MSIWNTKKKKQQKGFWGRELLKYIFIIQGFCDRMLDLELDLNLDIWGWIYPIGRQTGNNCSPSQNQNGQTLSIVLYNNTVEMSLK